MFLFFNYCNIFFRTNGDRFAEGKASGNLGNTFKLLGQYEESLVFLQLSLDISRELGDKVRDYS